MTVIAARKTKDVITFASDSILVAGYLKATDKEVIYNKLFQQNDMVIGSTGTGYEGTMMELFSRNHRPVDGSRLAVIDFFVEFREWINKRDSSHSPENDYLIAYDQKLFRTYGGLDIYEVPEFEAVGAGEDFAKAALHLGHSPREAVEVACKLSIYCSEPISEITIEI
ncbi:hypothetical protein D0962_02975 [Leptolyngbyaceae cyanobacterium CCMR0082]|uniref:Uncharacterized protein n=2 Tax=Adonisia turfae TaxID=2950184 RepID=A0A6M0RZW5_9CYAN|nr:hypothetical protein [Adonisia turfae]MDV3352154.1 hypothetical protein [Leptothoe sp. LEGE 181152]NEZ59549.1 hypothetical protein [Adonisia turfae CCMR0081]NEZ61747.1 hypothetical protein [Adonisia turfae CCMR0082]